MYRKYCRENTCTQYCIMYKISPLLLMSRGYVSVLGSPTNTVDGAGSAGGQSIHAEERRLVVRRAAMGDRHSR